MLPVLEGSEAGVPFKFPEKISQIIKSAVQADVHDRLIRRLQKDDGLFDPVFVDIGYWGFSKDAFEKTAEILFVHIRIFSQIPDIDFFLIVFPDKFQGGFNDPHTVVVCFFPMSQQRERRKDTKDL